MFRSQKNVRLVDAEDDSAIGHQMEGAVVVNLTDEVQRLSCGIRRNPDSGNRLVRLVDSHFLCVFFGISADL